MPLYGKTGLQTAVSSMAPYDATSTWSFFGSKTCIFKMGQIQTYFDIYGATDMFTPPN